MDKPLYERHGSLGHEQHDHGRQTNMKSALVLGAQKEQTNYWCCYWSQSSLLQRPKSIFITARPRPGGGGRSERISKSGLLASLAACCLDGSGAERRRGEDERRRRAREGEVYTVHKWKGKTTRPTTIRPTVDLNHGDVYYGQGTCIKWKWFRNPKIVVTVQP